MELENYIINSIGEENKDEGFQTFLLKINNRIIYNPINLDDLDYYNINNYNPWYLNYVSISKNKKKYFHLLLEDLKNNENNIEKLDFSRNHNLICGYMDRYTLIDLSKVLEINFTLKYLDLSKNTDFKDITTLESLGKSLRVNNTLEYLNLSGCLIENNIIYLIDQLKFNTSIKYLNLSKNNFRNINTNLSELLIENNILQYLDLSNNKLKNGFIHLINGLKRNNHLIYLNLHNTRIANKEAFQLSEVLNLNTALKFLDISKNFILNSYWLSNSLEQNRKLEYIKFPSIKNNKSTLDLIQSLNSNYSLKYLSLKGWNFKSSGLVFLFSKYLKFNLNLTYLDLSYCNISNTHFYYLAVVIKNHKTLLSVNLAGNHIDKIGWQLIEDILNVNTTLLYLNLSNNEFDKDAIICLSNALKNNNTLQQLDLSNCYFYDFKCITDALRINTGLKFINFSECNLEKNVIYLKEVFNMNIFLKCINLSDNSIDESEALELFESLMVNESLYYINMKRNKFSKSTIDKIIKKINKTLKYIELSEIHHDYLFVNK